MNIRCFSSFINNQNCCQLIFSQLGVLLWRGLPTTSSICPLLWNQGRNHDSASPVSNLFTHLFVFNSQLIQLLMSKLLNSSNWILLDLMRLNGLMHFLCSFAPFSKKDTGGNTLYIFCFTCPWLCFIIEDLTFPWKIPPGTQSQRRGELCTLLLAHYNTHKLLI